MDKQEAFGLIENFHASHEIAKAFEAQGRHLPHDFDYAKGADFYLDHPEQFSDVALPGQTYSGPIEYIEEGHAIQRINESSTVAHDLKRLVGMDPSQLVGNQVEIRYPHGQVGIVAALDKGREMAVAGLGEREHTQSMKHGAEFGGWRTRIEASNPFRPRPAAAGRGLFLSENSFLPRRFLARPVAIPDHAQSLTNWTNSMRTESFGGDPYATQLL